jgi:galactose mutarotase-like enzyme
MMPTIVACPYPGPGAALGAPLPDHGELWTEPWQAEATESAVTLHADGRSLPYRFARTATLAEPDTLVLDYSVENTGSETLLYLWAAHPQFRCEPGAEVVLPPEIDHVVNVLPAEWGAEWGPPGGLTPWPLIQAGAARLFPGRVGDISRRAGRKFYVPPDRRITWAGLWRPAVQCGLQMTWQSAAAPYWGIWVDEGAFYPSSSVVALEPTNGYYDSLALAAANDRVGKLAPGARTSWRVSVRVGAGQLPFPG